MIPADESRLMFTRLAFAHERKGGPVAGIGIALFYDEHGLAESLGFVGLLLQLVVKRLHQVAGGLVVDCP